MSIVHASHGRLIDRMAYGVDGLVLAQIRKHSATRSTDPQRLLNELRTLEDAPLYAAALADPTSMFFEPDYVQVSKRLLAPHRVGLFEWSWRSQHPLMFPGLERKYRARRANQRAVLRTLKLKLSGSTIAIVVNGFSSGHHLVERLMPAQARRGQTWLGSNADGTEGEYESLAIVRWS